ncbi:unnamed protein product, partial [Symbiodinium pilosum]
MGEILCTSVDDCRRKLEGSLSKLGDFVGSWASENLQKLSDQGLKGVKALEAQGNAGFQAMESIQTQVDGTVGSIKDFFSGAAQEATNIVQRYGFINSLCAPDGINSRFPIAVWTISDNFDAVVDKLKQCASKKYQNKLPTPFMDVSVPGFCLPEVARAPLKGIVAAVRYAIAEGGPAASTGFMNAFK